MDITFPIASEDDLLIKLEQTLQKHPNIKLAITGGRIGITITIPKNDTICKIHLLKRKFTFFLQIIL